MPMVWLKARAAFTFQGRPLAIDDVFGATPIEAVTLRARRLVEFARKPPTVTVEQIATVFGVPPESIEPQAIPARRPRGRPRKVATSGPASSVQEPIAPYIPPDDNSSAASTVAPDWYRASLGDDADDAA